MKKSIVTLAVAAFLAAGTTVAAAAEKAVATESVKMTAKVTAVDQEKRVLTLEGKDGKQASFVVSDEVKRLKEIKAGDMVVVAYTQSLAVEMGKPGSSGVAVKEDTAKNKASERPGVKGSREVKATVTIDSVDLKNNIVTFTGPQGGVNVVQVQRPQMKEFIKTLKVGDKVDVTFTEAVAVSVEAAKGK